jgi:hypothetical protein
MVDVRRAYSRWLRRRLLWLGPSFLLSCAVGAELAADPNLPGWVRIPSLALAGGVALLFTMLGVQTILVGREKSLGRGRRAQLLRTELRPYRGIAFASLLLLLMLLAVPSLFPEQPPILVPSVHRPPGHAVEARIPAPAPAPPPAVAVPAEVPVPAPVPAPAPETPVAPPPTPPQIVPEIVRIPELPMRLEDFERPALPVVQEERSPELDRFGMKHRPGPEDDVFSDLSIGRQALNRVGLPAESDPVSWIPPELRVDAMIVTRTGPWRGAAFEMSCDLPIGRDDSVRLTYAVVMLNNELEFDGIEPSFAWHRATFEYVRRLAGYTRSASFDLALRIGMTVDRIGTHEAGMRFNPDLRPSPWLGLESALWEDEGVGLVLQAGHSFATRLTGGLSSVTDLRVVVRIDLGERSSLELGYRMMTVQFRDKNGPSSDDYDDKMSQTFRGPVLGLALRF